MGNTLKRTYSGSDAYMVEQSGVGQALLLANLAAFTAFDSTINAAFATTMAADVQAAFLVVKDTQAIAPQIAQTVKVLNYMQEGVDAYTDIMYFVTHKAFKGNKAVAKEFGRSTYTQAHRSQPKFSVFLASMNLTANKYKTQLIAGGCTQVQIDNILTVANSLRTSDVNQEVMKRGRPVLTNARVVVMNACYGDLAIVNAAAQQVYKNDEEKKKQYVYNPSNKSAVVTDVSMPIAAAETLTVMTLPYNPDRTFTLQALATSLEFGLSTDGTTIVGTTFTVAAGDLLIKKSSDMNTVGDILICKNITAIAGSFNVEADR